MNWSLVGIELTLLATGIVIGFVKASTKVTSLLAINAHSFRTLWNLLVLHTLLINIEMSEVTCMHALTIR